MLTASASGLTGPLMVISPAQVMAHVPTLAPFFGAFAAEHIGRDDSTLAAFAYFSASDAGASLRLRAIQWIETALGQDDSPIRSNAASAVTDWARVMRKITAANLSHGILLDAHSLPSSAGWFGTKPRIGGSPLVELLAIETWIYFGHGKPEALRQIMPHLFHVHGKFFEVGEQGNDDAVDYPAIIEILVGSGYDGWISSEHEGHHWLNNHDAFNQVRLHQDYLRRLIEECAAT